jgi:hypothetical protein
MQERRKGALTDRLNVIPVEQVVKSFATLREICALPRAEEAMTRVESLLRSLVALEDEDYGGALVYAWTAVEAMLRDRFNDYLTAASKQAGEGTVFITSDRQNFLSGPQITSRHMAEILSLAGSLPFDLYRATVKSGNRRNRWLHVQKPVMRDEACEAIETAVSLFDFTEGISLTMPLDRRLTLA